MSQKTKILISILISILLLFLGVYKINKKKIEPPPVPINKIAQDSEVSNLITLKINETKYETKISGPINVYDLMQKLADEGKIKFKYETYTGMGKFIEEINGIKNGEKNWLYYVNNKKANIGISNYKISPGDVVSWKYENNY